MPEARGIGKWIGAKLRYRLKVVIAIAQITINARIHAKQITGGVV